VAAFGESADADDGVVAPERAALALQLSQSTREDRRVEAGAELHHPAKARVRADNPRQRLDQAQLRVRLHPPDELERSEETAFAVVHPSGAPAFALRLEVADRIIAYSGDTEWTETLIDVGRAADLLLSECYSFKGKPKFHLNYKTLKSNIERIEAKRVLLTHMGEDMLARLDQLTIDAVEDGQLIEL
jgi:ribonuclease BN (tRNA processing enzyme)